MRFMDWLAVSPLATALKTFVAVVLSAAVADWATGGEISLAAWQTWVISACVSAVPLLVNALNPQDPRYGVKDPALFQDGGE